MRKVFHTDATCMGQSDNKLQDGVKCKFYQTRVFMFFLNYKQKPTCIGYKSTQPCTHIMLFALFDSTFFNQNSHICCTGAVFILSWQ